MRIGRAALAGARMFALAVAVATGVAFGLYRATQAAALDPIETMDVKTISTHIA